MATPTVSQIAIRASQGADSPSSFSNSITYTEIVTCNAKKSDQDGCQVPTERVLKLDMPGNIRQGHVANGFAALIGHMSR